ncbi:MAG TPA: glycosyltransferase, partial [Candidatus Acidoferrales bacterium]|nr:glycosyltransferase [Candidatus Acidoferrales bacterium]
MTRASSVLGLLCVAIWLYLLFARGGFWLVHPADESPSAKISDLSARRVVAIIPARNEAGVVGKTIASLLQQEFPGRLELVLVDDHSSDGTAVVAREAAAREGAGDRLNVVAAGPLPEGWTGKLWAIAEGLKLAGPRKPDYFLFTDADILHAPQNISGLVSHAVAENLDLASLMVKLECRTIAEKSLFPAFLFFFLKLYPPAWTASAHHRTAGAAGGCLLIRPQALERMGGIAQIRSELIEDCALAHMVKRRGGKIWMGVTRKTRSMREAQSFRDIWRMIARTAFTQLRYSGWLLAGAVLGMAVTYLAPLALLFSGDRVALGSGLAAWLLMTLAYLPALRFYGQSLA